VQIEFRVDGHDMRIGRHGTESLIGDPRSSIA
jgi:hypothetical protein